MNHTNHVDDDRRTAETTTLTRRNYLSALSGISLATITPPTNDESRRPAEDLLVQSTLLPDLFTPLPDPGDIPLFTQLQATHPRFQSADFAANRFCVGEDPNNPRWVFASGACVLDEQTLGRVAVNVTEQDHKDFIREYEAETPGSWAFNQKYSSNGAIHDWQSEVYITNSWSENSEELTESHPTLVDTIRLQVHGPILLWTVLFGPANGRWSYTRLFDAAAEQQRTRLASKSPATNQ